MRRDGGGTGCRERRSVALRRYLIAARHDRAILPCRRRMRSGSAVDHALINFYVVLRHAAHRKTLLEHAPATRAIEMADCPQRLDRLLDVIDNIAADLIVQDFGHRAVSKSYGRRAASHGF